MSVAVEPVEAEDIEIVAAPPKKKKAAPVIKTMIFSVMQEQLVKALEQAAKAIDSRPSLPILANILIETMADQVRISATNLEASVQVVIGARIDKPGSVTLPAKTLIDVVSKMSPERIDFWLDESTLTATLKGGTSTSQVKGLSATEFPPIASPDSVSLTMSGSVLKKMIAQTEFSAATEDNRPILTGLFCQIEKDIMTLASADGYRLAVRTGKLAFETAFMRPIRSMSVNDERLMGQTLSDDAGYYGDNRIGKMVVVPRNTLITPDVLQKLQTSKVTAVDIHPYWLTDSRVDPITTVPVATWAIVEKMIDAKSDEEIQITLPGDRDLVCFQYGRTTVVSQTLEGKFPDFSALIPRSYETGITVFTADLLKAFKRAEVFARDSNYSVRISAIPSDTLGGPGTLKIVGRSAERGENEGMVDAEVEGAALEFAVNVKYMIDVLAHIPEERVRLTTNGASHPMLVCPENDSSFLHVVMPMSIAT